MIGRILKRNEVLSSPRGMSFIGKLKIGAKNPNGKGAVSFDYFTATGPYASYFQEVYPDQPSKVQIAFISDDIRQACFEEVDGRDKQGRRAGYSQDGHVYYLYDVQAEDYFPTEDRTLLDSYSQQHQVTWTTILNLHFIIPKIRGVFGLWKFQTRGEKSSMPAIVETFDYVQQRVGSIVNFPFDLIVEKVKSQKPGSKSVYPVVNLIANFGEDNMATLRKYFEAGMSFQQFGVLTEEKLKAIEAPKAMISPPRMVPTEEEKAQWGNMLKTRGTKDEQDRARQAWQSKDWSTVQALVEQLESRDSVRDDADEPTLKDLLTTADDTLKPDLHHIAEHGTDEEQGKAVDIMLSTEGEDRQVALHDLYVGIEERLAKTDT